MHNLLAENSHVKYIITSGEGMRRWEKQCVAKMHSLLFQGCISSLKVKHIKIIYDLQSWIGAMYELLKIQNSLHFKYDQILFSIDVKY